MGLSQQAFNILKNAVLNHPFEISQAKFNMLRKLFSELLFSQTFDTLKKINEGISENSAGVVVQKDHEN
jgi:hypothetical protein